MTDENMLYPERLDGSTAQLHLRALATIDETKGLVIL